MKCKITLLTLSLILIVSLFSDVNAFTSNEIDARVINLSASATSTDDSYSLVKSWDISKDGNSNVTASLYQKGDVIYQRDRYLIISGTGEMKDWHSYAGTPWYKYEKTALVGADVTNIHKVIIESGVTSIGNYAFSGAKDAHSILNSGDVVVKIPNTVTRIGEYGVANCHIDGGFPSSVTSIGDYAFKNCTGLGDLVIPTTVTSVGSYAFNGSSIATVNVQNDIISNYEFRGCSSLTNATISNNVKSIGESAFRGCSSLTSIEIPASVTKIGASAFEGCSSLTSIEIPESVTNIGAYAFYGCSILEAINVNSNNENYTSEDGVLFNKDKTKLIKYPSNKPGTTYTIPATVTTIDKYAFENCANLKHLIFQNDILGESESTLSNVFTGSTLENVTDITITADVTNLNVKNFNIFYNLKNINVNDDNAKYSSVDGILFNKDKTVLIKYPTGKDGSTYTIPTTTNEIGQYAFSECNNLIKINANDITKINLCSFSNCTKLSYVSLEKLTEIPSCAFDNCDQLVNVNTPYTEEDVLVKSIEVVESGKNVYLYGDSLDLTDGIIEVNYSNGISKKIALDDSEVNVSGYDKNTSGIQELTVEYKGCKDVYSVEVKGQDVTVNSISCYSIPEKRTYLYNEQIDLNGGIITVQFSDNTEIKVPMTFNGVTSSATANAEDGKQTVTVEYLGKSCTFDISVKEQSITVSKIEIYGTPQKTVYAFGEELDLEGDKIKITYSDDTTSYMLTTSENVEVNGYNNNIEGTQNISIKYADKTVTYEIEVIKENNVNIPNVTEIKARGFYGCNGIKNISIPSGVTSLVKGTFYDSPNVKSIYIDENIEKIEAHVIDASSYLNRKLEYIYVNENNNNYCDVDGVLFSKDKTELIEYPWGRKSKSYKIPTQETTKIKAYAFSDCKSIEYIEIPSEVTTIEDEAFAGCSSLANIEIPATVTTIGECAFAECSSLTSIEIPSGVTIIEWATFSDCSSLESVSIPNGIINIEGYAFENCSSLTNIDLPKGLTTIEMGAFKGCSSLTNIEIPSEVTTIEDEVFFECSSLENVNIPNGVTSIGYSVFYGVKGPVFYSSNCSEMTYYAEGNWDETDFVCDDDAPTISFPEEGQVYEEGVIPEIVENKVSSMGNTINCVKKVTLQKDGGDTVEYESGTEIIEKGKYTLVATDYVGNESVVKFAIKDANDIEYNCTVENIPDQVYTGKAITPEVVVKYGEIALEKDRDYTVEYSNNINVGEATVTITATGNYTGEITKTFNIVAKGIAGETAEGITVENIPNQVYTGNAITPEVIVKYGEIVLEKDRDYTVEYSNNINVGEATVTITATGNYTGEITATFNIVAKGIAGDTEGETAEGITVENIPDQVYTGNAITPEVVVKYGEIALEKDRDYTVEYSNNINVGEATVTITATGNYTGEITKTFNIVAKGIAGDTEGETAEGITVENIPNQVYTGSAITPEVVVKYGEIALEKDRDYTVEYSNNINVGEATVTITATGNYTGEITATFNIYKDRFVVTFKNYDGTILQQREEMLGETPKYEGETPTKLSTLDYKYVFVGWDKEIAIVTQEAEYIARFEEEERVVKELVITNPTDKVEYFEGENFVSNGITVDAIFDDYTRETITEFIQIENGENLQPDQESVIIKYKGVSIEQPITVVAKKLDHIEMRKEPNKKVYISGENFDPEGMQIIAVYNNGSEEEITDYEYIPNGALTESVNKIIIKYTKDGVDCEIKLDIIVDYKYKILNGKYIARIQPNTNKEQFINEILNNESLKEIKEQTVEGEEITIYNDNVELSSEDKVGTGMTLKVNNSNTYDLIVIGDVNGDGTADFNDILLINKHRLNKENGILEDPYLIAGDVNGDGKADFKDILKINKFRLGVINVL